MTLKKYAPLSVGLILAGILILPSPARAVEVKIKLYGGYSYLAGGDLNKGTEGLTNMWKELFEWGGATVNGSFQPAHMGPSFGGELILMFSPALGIGFGSEYLRASKTSTIDLTLGSSSAQMLPIAEASAVPLNLSLYFSFSGGPGFRVNLHVGGGYYMAKMLSRWRLQEGSDYVQIDSTAKANEFGFHGGLGFEFDLSPNIALFLEARGRYASLGNFKGDGVAEISGTVIDQISGDLYYSENKGLFAAFYPVIEIDSTMPTPDASTRNVRQAKIDFSGGTLLGGIVFKF